MKTLDFNTKRHLPALTGLRAIAAWLVFCHHLNPFLGSGSQVSGFLNELHIGVSIFFVLSGFLICLRYFETEDSGKVFAKNYVRNRVARVYPMYFFFTAATFIYYYATKTASGETPGIFAANITFLRGFFDDISMTGVAQGWSLTVEECFYFSAPIIFLIYRRKNLFFSQAAILIGVGAVLWFLCRNLDFYGLFGGMKFTLGYTFFGRCNEFFMGILLALTLKGKASVKFPFPKKFATYKGIVFIFISVCLLSAISQLKGTDHAFRTFEGVLVNNFVLPFGIIILFYGLVMEKTPVSSFLSTRVMDLLGKSSYTFYLIHIGILYKLFFPMVNGNFFLYFIVVSLTSVILYTLVEEPLNKLIRGERKPAIAIPEMISPVEVSVLPT